jgi:hypothetical protein
MQVLEEPLDKDTELMKEFGPQETTYCVSWDKEDESFVNRYFRKADKIKEDSLLIIEFWKQLERKYNDHQEAYIQFENRKLYLVEIARALDIPTIQGIVWCNKMQLTASLAPWRYMGVGTDSREARVYHQQLFGETSTRMDMTVAGSMTRVNESMNFSATFPSAYATITVRESAIFNVSSGFAGTQLNRNSFPDFPIVHTQGVLPFTVASDFNFAAETKWG